LRPGVARTAGFVQRIGATCALITVGVPATGQPQGPGVGVETVTARVSCRTDGEALDPRAFATLIDAYVRWMEFQDVVRGRRMVRDFSDEPVPRALVERLLHNATRVPSAGYSQGSAFVVLTDSDQRRLFWETTSGPAWRGESESEPLTRAPVVIIPLAHKQAYLDRYGLPDKVHTPLSREDEWPVPYWDIDTGFGVMLILLTAIDLGLGALFFAIFAGEQVLMDALDVPAGYRPIGAIAVGHPTAGERSKPELSTGRRHLEEVVRWERW
jgi:nitroreductase